MAVIRVDDPYAPRHAGLELTLACNMKCLHCGSKATKKNRKNPLSILEWFEVIDQLKELGTQCFHLSGGEPLLSPHLYSIVEHLQYSMDRPVPFTVITNGALLTPEMLDHFTKHGLSHIAVSIDGTRPCHNFIRQTDDAFEKAVAAVRLCGERQVPVSVMTSVNKYNFCERHDILDLMLGLKIENWQVQVVNSFGRARQNRESMLISRDDYCSLVEDIASWRKKHNKRMNIFAADSIGYCHSIFNEILGDSQWSGCNAGLYVIGIQADGAVTGCLSLQNGYFYSGNVRERPLAEIWGDDGAFAYTRRYDTSRMTGRCGKCAHKTVCRAGCLSMAYSVNDSIYENTYCYENIQGR